MKKNQFLLLSLFLGTVIFSSCEKNLYDEDKLPEKDHTVANLNIPSNFNWKMTKNAECTVTTTNNTPISVYLDKSCSESELVASFTTNSENAPLSLSLPSYVNELYFQYETSDGQKKVISASLNGNGNINIALPSNPRAMVQTRDNNDIKTDQSDVVYYPKNGWGTIMFEDLFPGLGDYDFNDFVMNYKVQLYEVEKTGNGNNKNYTTKAMQIGARLKAMGGSLDYRPYLRIHGLKRADISSISLHESFNTKITEVKLIEGKNGETIIDLSELTDNLHKPAGSHYYNTEKEYAISSDKLPQINIYIELKEPVIIKGNLEDEDFEFYLAHENGTEIHLSGYEPVAYKYPIDNKNILPLDGNIANYYYSVDRLIWGLKVPDDVAQAIEKANFLDAYKNFEKWATSGGQNDSNWYGQGNSNKDLLMPLN